MSSTSTKTSFFSRKIIMGTSIGAAIVFFFAGIIFWGGFNTAMEATNTLEFCTSCHEMENNVYQEYKPTIHHSNRSGVRATCSDCHVPKPWVHKVVRKIKASNEVWHKMLGSIDTPEKFDAKRLKLAKNVWRSMKETDSRECRNCHNLDSMNPVFQKPRARNQHLNAFKTGQTCIDCHKGIAHKDVRDLLSDEELEELEKPNPAFIREVPHMFAEGMKQVELAEKEAEIKAKEDELKANEKLQKQIDAAVNEALSGSGASANNSSSNNAPGESFDIDWKAVPERKITLFYPGQASMEWVLTGKDHGGARPFVKLGDRCVTCHDKETNKMGDLIVSGEKLENPETLIPGKRGNIPVNVQARYDDKNLYLRFEWENSEHTPAPFIEGGKMDDKNQMKLAVMFATDDVKYAQQAGCWGACHHDLNTMPHNPEGEDVHKYIEESRTKIEVKGRRGKMRGGWNNLKDEAALATELSAGHILDIVRYKAGEHKSEDGHILADRNMSGGNTEFNAVLSASNTWVVEMKRELNSGKSGDVKMTTDKMYNFSFAIHDDYTTARFHHVSLGYFLGFDNDKAEINAIKIK